MDDERIAASLARMEQLIGDHISRFEGHEAAEKEWQEKCLRRLDSIASSPAMRLTEEQVEIVGRLSDRCRQAGKITLYVIGVVLAAWVWHWIEKILGWRN